MCPLLSALAWLTTLRTTWFILALVSTLINPHMNAFDTRAWTQPPTCTYLVISSSFRQSASNRIYLFFTRTCGINQKQWFSFLILHYHAAANFTSLPTYPHQINQIRGRCLCRVKQSKMSAFHFDISMSSLSSQPGLFRYMCRSFRWSSHFNFFNSSLPHNASNGQTRRCCTDHNIACSCKRRKCLCYQYTFYNDEWGVETLKCVHYHGCISYIYQGYSNLIIKHLRMNFSQGQSSGTMPTKCTDINKSKMPITIFAIHSTSYHL